LKKKNLRSGYTTGACAAAAAKAAVELLLSAEMQKCKSAKENEPERVGKVEIPFPDGSRVEFSVHNSKLLTQNSGLHAIASVIKDAGDDPDVTNGAEIAAQAQLVQKSKSAEVQKGKTCELIIKGGKGVGIVTKPGLSVPVGGPAINPVPRRMIEEAVRESSEGKILRSCDLTDLHVIEITISVPEGEELAKKTLNHRLGIIGGISILGTTGIVKPVSTEAWTATISSSMDVAKAMGHREIVLSAGRTSEKAHMKKYGLPEEAYVLMGDYLEYSLQEAGKHGFEKIYLCAQWAKLVKIAMATPQTHVRFGAIDIPKAVEFMNSLGIKVPERGFNTAREIFELIAAEHEAAQVNAHLKRICVAAKKYAEDITVNTPVMTYLVSYDGKVISGSE
jgi:cobalt-precorrin-5B (C1)-methyltransferase